MQDCLVLLLLFVSMCKIIKSGLRFKPFKKKKHSTGISFETREENQRKKKNWRPGEEEERETKIMRSFLKGYCSPKAARRQVIASKHLDYGFDDLESQVKYGEIYCNGKHELVDMDKLQDLMMQDVDFSPHASSIEQLFGSRDIVDVVGDPNQRFSNFQKSSSFTWNDSNLKSDFSEDKLFNSSRESSRNIWNGSVYCEIHLFSHDTFITSSV